MNGVYLTIDTGTTNTRVTVLKDGALLAQAKSETGVRVSAIDGDNHRLKQAVRQCLDEALDRAGIGWDQVCGVAANGMITSNVGLCEIPHCTAPAGAAELAARHPIRLHARDLPFAHRLYPRGEKLRRSGGLEQF